MHEAQPETVQAWMGDVDNALRWIDTHAAVRPVIVDDSLHADLREFLRAGAGDILDALIVARGGGSAPLDGRWPHSQPSVEHRLRFERVAQPRVPDGVHRRASRSGDLGSVVGSPDRKRPQLHGRIGRRAGDGGHPGRRGPVDPRTAPATNADMRGRENGRADIPRSHSSRSPARALDASGSDRIQAEGFQRSPERTDEGTPRPCLASQARGRWRVRYAGSCGSRSSLGAGAFPTCGLKRTWYRSTPSMAEPLHNKGGPFSMSQLRLCGCDEPLQRLR